MIIKDMFAEDISRDIRGVIKADQTEEEDVYQELQEYVVTRELHEHFAKFYDNYTASIDGQTDKVGVWISGFFGSGKSHFLKILSYLLENREVKGKKAVEFFEDKIQDPFMYANMERVANMPTETILFNIDSKSSMGNKEKEDAILRVLLKVFNEHRGYYGDNPAVAELEKYLDDNNFFNDFKKEFEKVANEPWENRRNSFYFDSGYIKTALLHSTNMTEDSIEHWLQHGADNVEISIESFAHEVKEYLDKKEDDFRLVFLIDEIGQYIGDRRDLMLNLQTVTENLGTICDGRAWIIVTSQESIDTVVKVKGDDFSRIQGRFDTRLSLSSISVDEVIQKRILEKKDYVFDTLKAIYIEKGAILRNVINFTPDTRADLLGYQDVEEFANIYPFVPYQFNLLQSVFEQVRRHGSSGKHLSEGERSMLSAYRESGMQFMQEEQGTLIPFYAFYDTIKEFLQPTITRVIERANENPELKDDPFHTNLLKVLFMIKYVEEIPSNIDNLATLMVSHIDEDKLSLKEKIKASLRKLLGQTLIQKHGDLYIFLTDDEQDINREIEQILISDEEVKKELADYIYQDLYHVNQYSYSDVYSFRFNKKMDEKNYGSQTNNIGINILSPLSDHYNESEQDLMMLSSGTNEIVLKLGGSGSFIEEIEQALKIEAYRSKRRIHELPENIQNILNNKRVEIRERRERARTLLADAIKEGQFYINGSLTHITGSTVREKLNNAFKRQVENTFAQLLKVNTHIYRESELKDLLTADTEQISLTGKDIEQPNELAKNDIHEFITLEEQMRNQITIKSIYDRFENPPYGWRKLDIARMISELLMEQKIRIRYEGEFLEPREDADALVTAFTRAIEHGKAIITDRKKVDQRLMNRVRRLAQDLFNQRDIASDEDGLIQDLRTLIKEKEEEIKRYQMYYEQEDYPGRAILIRGLENFSAFDKSIDNLTFFNRFAEKEEDLEDWFELYEYVESFFNSDQKEIYESGLSAFSIYEDVKDYLVDENIHQAMKELDKILNFDEPFSRIKDIPKLVQVFHEGYEQLLQERRKAVANRIETDFDEVSLRMNDERISDITKKRIDDRYKGLLEQVHETQDVYRIDAMVTQSENIKNSFMKSITKEIEQWKAAQTEDEQSEDIQEPVIETEKVNVSQLVQVERLTSEEDVDKYVRTLSSKLKEIVRSNKEIKLL